MTDLGRHGCGALLVVSRDAIGRERLRCPRCHGVAPQRPLRAGETRRVQSVDVAAARPTPAPPYRQFGCATCGKPVPANPKGGRPRKLCADCETPGYRSELETKARENARRRQLLTEPPGIRPLETE